MSSSYVAEGGTNLTFAGILTGSRIGGTIHLLADTVLNLFLLDCLNKLSRFPSLIQAWGCWVITLEGAIRLPGPLAEGLLVAAVVHLPSVGLVVLP